MESSFFSLTSGTLGRWTSFAARDTKYLLINFGAHALN
jgi:hypothetical protein